MNPLAPLRHCAGGALRLRAAAGPSHRAPASFVPRSFKTLLSNSSSSASSGSSGSRMMSTGSPVQARLGKITPKRIAIPVMEGATGEGFPQRSVWRPIIFALGVGLGGFTLAALYTNWDTSVWLRRLGTGFPWRLGGDPSDSDIQRAKQIEHTKRAQETLNSLPKTLSFLPDFILVPVMRAYIMYEEYKINTPPAATSSAMLIGGMGLVFLAWRVPRWHRFMNKWFMHRSVLLGGGAKREWANCITMFTSTISHQTLAHFAFNSIALYSFGYAAYAYISSPPPGEQPLPTSTQTPQFYAFLLAAGLFSSLGSHLFANLVRLPRLLKLLQSPARLSSASALAAHQAIIPSLGASGAIYGAVTLTALSYPDSHVSIIFLPFISIPVGVGVAGMVAMDVVGIIRGWRTFDHVAHFAGAMFGVIYYQYGRQFYSWLRRQLGAQQHKGFSY